MGQIGSRYSEPERDVFRASHPGSMKLGSLPWSPLGLGGLDTIFCGPAFQKFLGGHQHSERE